MKNRKIMTLLLAFSILLSACQAPNVARIPENTKGIQGIGVEGSTSIPSVKVVPDPEDTKPSVTGPETVDPVETQEVADSSEMSETPAATESPETPVATETPEPPAATELPEPPTATELPEPPAATELPEPPAATELPEPPAATETPDTPVATVPPETPAAIEPSVALDPVDVTETGAGEGYLYRALAGDPMFTALKLGDGREAPYTSFCTLLLKGKDEVEDLLSGIDVGEVISVWGSQEESSKKTVSRDEYFKAIRERYDEEFFAGKMLLLVKVRTPSRPYSGGEVSLAKDGGILRVITTLITNRAFLEDAMSIYCFYVEIDRSVLEGVTEFVIERRTARLEAVTGFAKSSAPAETPAKTSPIETGSAAQEYGKPGSWSISSGKREKVIRLWKRLHPDEAFLRVSDVDTWLGILNDLSQDLPELRHEYLSEAEGSTLRNRYDRAFFEQNDLIFCELTMGESTYGITSVETVAEAGRFTLTVNLLTPPATQDETGSYVVMKDAEQPLDFFIEMDKQCSSELEFFEAVVGKIEAAESMDQYLASKVGQ